MENFQKKENLTPWHKDISAERKRGLNGNGVGLTFTKDPIQSAYESWKQNRDANQVLASWVYLEQDFKGKEGKTKL